MNGKRALVALVGSETEDRAGLASALIQDGEAVVICGGPPGCPLLRGDRCPVVDAADAVVVMSGISPTSEVAIGLTRCAFAARTAIAIEPSAVHPLSGAARVPLGSADEMACAIRPLLSSID